MSDTVEFVDEVCGIYFRSILLAKAGDRATQHMHDYDHATYIGAGAAALYVDGKPHGNYPAGHAVAVRAGHEHMFVALVPGTRLTCVHHAQSAERAKEKELLVCRG